MGEASTSAQAALPPALQQLVDQGYIPASGQPGHDRLWIRFRTCIARGGRDTEVHRGWVVNPKKGELTHECAVKAVKLHGAAPFDSQAFKRAEKEGRFFTMMSKEGLEHSNIVRGYMDKADPTCNWNGSTYFILPMELCDGDLSMAINPEYKVKFTWMQRQEGVEDRGPVVDGQLSYLQRKRILQNIVQGVYQVHREGGIIRDLKPQNVLLKWEGNARSPPTLTAKLADFNLWRHEDDVHSSCDGNQRAVGTTGYRAPELYDTVQKKYIRELATQKSDIFSLGVLAYNLLATCNGVHLPHPWDWRARDENMQQVAIFDGLDPKLPDLTEDDEEAWNLIRAMLQKQPALRPTADEILQHPFFYTLQQRSSKMEEWIRLLKSQELEGSTRKGEKLCSYLNAKYKLRSVFHMDRWDHERYLFPSFRTRALSKGDGITPPPSSSKGLQISKLVTKAVRNVRAHIDAFTVEEQDEVARILHSPGDSCFRQALCEELQDHNITSGVVLLTAYFHSKFPKLTLCLWTLENNGNCSALFSQDYSDRNARIPLYEGPLVTGGPPASSWCRQPLAIISRATRPVLNQSVPANGMAAVLQALGRQQASMQVVQPDPAPVREAWASSTVQLVSMQPSSTANPPTCNKGTGSSVPTLSNAPASAWAGSRTSAQVVNSQAVNSGVVKSQVVKSQARGYASAASTAASVSGSLPTEGTSRGSSLPATSDEEWQTAGPKKVKKASNTGANLALQQHRALEAALKRVQDADFRAQILELAPSRNIVAMQFDDLAVNTLNSLNSKQWQKYIKVLTAKRDCGSLGSRWFTKLANDCRNNTLSGYDMPQDAPSAKGKVMAVGSQMSAKSKAVLEEIKWLRSRCPVLKEQDFDSSIKKQLEDFETDEHLQQALVILSEENWTKWRSPAAGLDLILKDVHRSLSSGTSLTSRQAYSVPVQVELQLLIEQCPALEKARTDSSIHKLLEDFSTPEQLDLAVEYLAAEDWTEWRNPIAGLDNLLRDMHETIRMGSPLSAWRTHRKAVQDGIEWLVRQCPALDIDDFDSGHRKLLKAIHARKKLKEALMYLSQEDWNYWDRIPAGLDNVLRDFQTQLRSW